MVWLIFFLFLYVHDIACLWYYIVSYDEKWVPKKDMIFEDEYSYELYPSDFGRKYLLSFYTGYYLISSGEMTPNTNTEIVLALIIMIISSMILANVFG